MFQKFQKMKLISNAIALQITRMVRSYPINTVCVFQLGKHVDSSKNRLSKTAHLLTLAKYLCLY
jgi:hypothetical protein